MPRVVIKNPPERLGVKKKDFYPRLLRTINQTVPHDRVQKCKLKKTGISQRSRTIARSQYKGTLSILWGRTALKRQGAKDKEFKHGGNIRVMLEPYGKSGQISPIELNNGNHKICLTSPTNFTCDHRQNRYLKVKGA